MITAGCRLASLALFAIGLVYTEMAAADGLPDDARLPRLEFNETYIEDVNKPSVLALEQPMAIFAFVFGRLPERVKVYPTEGYYYFSFISGGVPIAGNIRIEPRDDGGQIVHFVYFEAASEWRLPGKEVHVVLDASLGVTVNRLEKLVYRLTYEGRSVVFALNDLSAVQPPATAVGRDEEYIGPICDESGVRFFLLWNAQLKIFHYVLDETVPLPDQLFPHAKTDRILIGKRTGFAFYRDAMLDRKILIGVHQSNSDLNTYFDGPFDQLPDNFIKGESLRTAILAVEPKLRGKIDRFGSDPGGEFRFLIMPYMNYVELNDLLVVHRCAEVRLKLANYHACFAADGLRQPARVTHRKGHARH